METNRTWEQTLSPVKLSYLQRFAQGTRFLDAGSGHCNYSRWLKEKKPQASITAIDLLPQNNSETFFSFLQADLEKPLPLSDNTFDTILAFDIIEHISNESLFISELFRVCKPHGILIGSVPHDNDKFLPAYNLTFRHRRDLTHKRYYRSQSLEKALTDSGFILYSLDKQGGVNPQLFAEFFPRLLQPLIKKSIGLCRRLHLIKTNMLTSDLFFVACKPSKMDTNDQHE